MEYLIECKENSLQKRPPFDAKNTTIKKGHRSCHTCHLNYMREYNKLRNKARCIVVLFLLLLSSRYAQAQCSHTLVGNGIYCEQSQPPAVVAGPVYVFTSVAASSGGSAVYTGAVTGGSGNAFAGLYFRVAGFTNAANNGGFICSASTATSLTLSNPSAVAETPTPNSAGAGAPSGPAQVIFPSYLKSELIFVSTEALTGGGQGWTQPMISDTNGYTWTFWGNVGSQSLDGNIVQDAVYYTVVPATTTSADTIKVSNPSSNYTLEYALVYSGVGAIDGSGAAIGWGGPGAGNASTGNFTASVGDLLVGYVFSSMPVPVAGWNARIEDIDNRGMLSDQIAASTTANASWTMATEGFIAIGLAFKPSTASSHSVSLTWTQAVLPAGQTADLFRR